MSVHEKVLSHEAITPNRILERITRRIEEDRFPFSPEPHQLYAFFCAATEMYGVEDYENYASTSITSGGAALPTKNGETLPFAEALALNEKFACSLMDAAAQDNPDIIDQDNYVNPVLLGKVKRWDYVFRGEMRRAKEPWGQDDYLRFWFAVICRIDTPDVPGMDREEHWYETAARVDALFDAHTTLTTDVAPIMNDKGAPIELRQKAYQEFTTRFIACMKYMEEDGQIATDPVERVVGLVDYERSLGCRSEIQLAEQLGITTTRLALTGDDWQSTSLAGVAETLGEHNAAFATPAGRVVLSLAPKLYDMSGVSLALATEDRESVLAQYQCNKEQRRRDIAKSMAKCIYGPENAAKEELVELMTQIALAIDRGLKRNFGQHYIDEVLDESRTPEPQPDYADPKYFAHHWE